MLEGVISVREGETTVYLTTGLANYFADHPDATIETVAQAARRKLEKEAEATRCDMPEGVEAAF